MDDNLQMEEPLGTKDKVWIIGLAVGFYGLVFAVITAVISFI